MAGLLSEGQLTMVNVCYRVRGVGEEENAVLTTSDNEKVDRSLPHRHMLVIYRTSLYACGGSIKAGDAKRPALVLSK